MTRPSRRLVGVLGFVVGLGTYDLVAGVIAGDLTGSLTMIATGVLAAFAFASHRHSQEVVRQQQVANEQQLQAVVLPSPGIVEPWGDGRLRVEVVLTNHGKTPALDLEWRAALHSLDPAAPVPKPPRETQPVDRMGMFGPAQVESLDRVFAESNPDTPGKRQHLVGTVRYRDIYGRTHETRFNWALLRTERGLAWAAGKTGNEMLTDLSIEEPEQLARRIMRGLNR